VTVNHVRYPAKLLDGFHHTANEEDTSFIVVLILLPLFINKRFPVLEIILIVNEIDLHPCRLNGGNLDDERMVGVIDDEVHAGETNYFVKLIAAFVDVAIFRHESAYLFSFFLYGLR